MTQNFPKVQLVCEIADSFFKPFLPDFCKELLEKGISASLIYDAAELQRGDIAFFISCKTIFSSEQLALNNFNVVIHPSKLPEGRGSGAVSWDILAGRNEIWVTLFSPTAVLDKGDIYYQDYFVLEGHELCDEIREGQAKLSLNLIRNFLRDYPNIPKRPQEGKGSFYRRRSPADSMLDPDKTIREQFNLLRTVDNQRYPAFFLMNGENYQIQIIKKK